MSSGPEPRHRALSDSIARLLRGEGRPDRASREAIDACLKTYECGGYLYRQHQVSGLLAGLPAEWREALFRSHRKTALDNLQALAEFRLIGRHLAEEGVPFILLKGAAYLVDLYDDPGERTLTDIDLLIRREDIGRLARCLERAGYETVVGEREFRRFEVKPPGREGCHFEFHWWLGHSLRSRISQEDVWNRAIPARLEGIVCRRLAIEDALLYHVAHQADHYFGPSLKWSLDLRRMLERWRPDPRALLGRAADWRLRAALSFALDHLHKLFPGSVPPGVREAAGAGPLRRRLAGRFLAADPVLLLAEPDGTISRFVMQGLLIDRPIDVMRQALRVLIRPILQRLGRGTRSDPEWTWLD